MRLAWVSQRENRTIAITCLCFLADDNSSPTKELSLEDFKKDFGGIDPFDIKDGTDWKDPKDQKLSQLGSMSAIRTQASVPPGMMKIIPGKGSQL